MNKVFIALSIIIALVVGGLFIANMDKSKQEEVVEEPIQQVPTLPDQQEYYSVTHSISKKTDNDNYLKNFFNGDQSSNKELAKLLPATLQNCLKEARKKSFEEKTIFFKGRRINMDAGSAQIITFWKNKESYDGFLSNCESADFDKALDGSDFSYKVSRETINKERAYNLFEIFKKGGELVKIDMVRDQNDQPMID